MVVSWRRSSPRTFSRRGASRRHSLRNRHHKTTTAVRSRVKATDRPQGVAVSLVRSWAVSRACSAAAAASLTARRGRTMATPTAGRVADTAGRVADTAAKHHPRHTNRKRRARTSLHKRSRQVAPRLTRATPKPRPIKPPESNRTRRLVQDSPNNTHRTARASRSLRTERHPASRRATARVMLRLLPVSHPTAASLLMPRLRPRVTSNLTARPTQLSLPMAHRAHNPAMVPHTISSHISSNHNTVKPTVSRSSMVSRRTARQLHIIRAHMGHHRREDSRGILRILTSRHIQAASNSHTKAVMAVDIKASLPEDSHACMK